VGPAAAAVGGRSTSTRLLVMRALRALLWGNATTTRAVPGDRRRGNGIAAQVTKRLGRLLLTVWIACFPFFLIIMLGVRTSGAPHQLWSTKHLCKNYQCCGCSYKDIIVDLALPCIYLSRPFQGLLVVV
jgi:hypothetical protein